MRLDLCVSICLYILLTGCMSPRAGLVQEAVDEVCLREVPDRRTGICTVSAEPLRGREILLRGDVLSGDLKEKLLAAARQVHRGVIDSVLLLPEPSVGDEHYGLVTVSVANLKAEPGHDAEMVSQALMGTPLRILRKRPGWFQVQTPDRYLSWVTTSSVQPVTSAQLERWRQSPRLLVFSHYGVVYSDTSRQQRISDLTMGCLVGGKGGEAPWCRVLLPDGRSGWADQGIFVDFEDWKAQAAATPENLLATAREFPGIPYMWGGTSPKALDCSGFTKMVWFLNGIILERDASQQYKYGEVVDAGPEQQNLRPGDLLFFGRKEPLRVIHVGIYSGNREVIHSSGQVAVNSMDAREPHFSSYLSGTYLGARRVTQLESCQGYMPVREHPWY